MWVNLLFLSLLASCVAKPAFSSVECLAKTLYHEARGESRKGQLAVAEVILNRVESARWPNSICGVITQQHQFVAEGVIRNKKTYAKLLSLSNKILDGEVELDDTGAVYFHNSSVQPSWAKQKTLTKKLGNHYFYR